MIDAEKRWRVRQRAQGYCTVCGKLRPLYGPDKGEVAHIVAKVGWAVRLYGEEAIDHVENLTWTCPEHNSRVLITFRPVPRSKHMERIIAMIDGRAG